MHTITRLYSQEFDFLAEVSKPSTHYMVATMPRSGSTLFCLELWKTGALGAPMEYLNLEAGNGIITRLSASLDIQKYWIDVQRLRTSPNGIFGYKMFMSNWLYIAKKHPEFLKKITPKKIIYLTRNDKLGQAISYSKAIRSNAWFSGLKKNTPVEFDRDHINYCKNLISQQEMFWEKLFVLTETNVLRVTYEELMLNPRAIAEKVAVDLGIAVNNVERLAIPLIGIQRDRSSLDWKRLYTDVVAST